MTTGFGAVAGDAVDFADAVVGALVPCLASPVSAKVRGMWIVVEHKERFAKVGELLRPAAFPGMAESPQLGACEEQIACPERAFSARGWPGEGGEKSGDTCGESKQTQAGTVLTRDCRVVN